MKQLVLIFINLLPIPLLWAAPVPLSDPDRLYDLFQASSLLEVKPGSVTIESLLQSPGRYAFQPTRNNLIRPNDRQRAYWFRADVTNETADAFFLHFVYSGTERITVYEVADSRVIGQRDLGRLNAEPSAYFRYSKLFWPMQVRRGQTHTLYVYMEGIYTTCLYFRARSAIDLLGAIHAEDLFYGLYYGFILMIMVYSFLLFVRLRERETLHYGVWVLSVGVQLALYRGFTTEFLWPRYHALEQYGSALAGLTGSLHVLFTLSFLRLRQQAPVFYRLGLVMLSAYVLSTFLFVGSVYWGGVSGKTIDIIPIVALFEGVFSVTAGTMAYRRGFRPALYYVIGNLVFFASIFVFLQYAGGKLPHTFWTYNSIHIGSVIEIILFTLALVNKVNLLKQGQEEAVREQLRLEQANRELVEGQNMVLEAKVQQRTNELNVQKEDLQKTLVALQATQQQLIQKEKMASLGELTAGIAHEIQNPLNFVNNFAELSAEMMDELKTELQACRTDDALAIADDLIPNLQKITHHGKRAESIVRSMLEHSRISSGMRQPTDLNALCGEYLQLAYQSLHTKDRTFSARLITSFDPLVGLVDMEPQEISRVLLNLYNNAFYATQEKAHQLLSGYQPQILVSTARENGRISVRVRDNGTGIAPHLLNKIYQPFFTTKPTGQGVGLGLSLSYDIITRSHGGLLEVQTELGQFTEFEIKLPQEATRE